MLLPIADPVTVRATAGRLIRQHRGGLAVVLLLHTLAAFAGLAGPALIGALIDGVTRGTITAGGIDATALVLLGAIVCQAVLIRFAQRQSMVLGEGVFAQLREEFLATVARRVRRSSWTPPASRLPSSPSPFEAPCWRSRRRIRALSSAKRNGLAM